MITSSPLFSTLLVTHRHEKELSQQELAAIGKINASDLSKLERGVKKRIQVDVLLKLIDGLQLTRVQAQELVEAAGYQTSILERVKFSSAKYPIATGVIEERLRGSYGFWPVWELTNDGVVTAANLLAFRLWRALNEYEETINSTRLLGENIFKVYIRPENLNRIAMPHKESDFFYSTLAIWKKLKDTVPVAMVQDFEKVIDAHPVLRLILHHGRTDIEREWEYDLRIYPAIADPSLHPPKMYLEYKIHVERILNDEHKHTGYLVSAQPLGEFTIDRVLNEYNRLLQVFGKEAFVQREFDTFVIEEEEKYPPFFPAVHLDMLSNIIFENTAFMLLCDPENQFLHKHYFDMLFSSRIIGTSENRDTQVFRIPVRRFLERTKAFEQEKHPLAKEYKEIKNNLLRHDIFATVQATLLRSLMSQQPNKQEKQGFYVTPPCPLDQRVPLSFVVEERLPLPTIEDYRVTFVPRTPPTTLALILLRLQATKEHREAMNTTEDGQYNYFLAVLKTVIEGMPKKKGKDDWGWHPETVMRHTYIELANANNSPDLIMQQLTWTLIQVLSWDEERQGDIVLLLQAFCKPLTHLHAFMTEYTLA